MSSRLGSARLSSSWLVMVTSWLGSARYQAELKVRLGSARLAARAGSFGSRASSKKKTQPASTSRARCLHGCGVVAQQEDVQVLPPWLRGEGACSWRSRRRAEQVQRGARAQGRRPPAARRAARRGAGREAAGQGAGPRPRGAQGRRPRGTQARRPSEAGRWRGGSGCRGRPDGAPLCSL